MKIILASHNKGKAKEFEKAFEGKFEVSLISDYCSDEPEENGITLEDNAIIKARHAFAATGLPSVADDSGLFVDALGGRPGVYSARYDKTDDLRIARLLNELKDVPPEKRTAAFKCCIAYIDSNISFTVEGICPGVILTERHGTGGFGYDPVFKPDAINKAFSEASTDEKNEISHRGLAIKKLNEKLKSLGII